MLRSTNKKESIDDLTDLEGASNLYQICEQKKVNGASNVLLRDFLKENGLDEKEIRDWLRQIDSDFLAGKLRKKKNKASFMAPIIGIVLLVVGISLLVIQLITGFVTLILIWFAFGVSTMGLGLISYNVVNRFNARKIKPKEHSRRDYWRSRQNY